MYVKTPHMYSDRDAKQPAAQSARRHRRARANYSSRILRLIPRREGPPSPTKTRHRARYRSGPRQASEYGGAGAFTPTDVGGGGSGRRRRLP